MAAQFVKPYVKSNKNDRVDAAAICEAMGRPGMRFVAVKTIGQQDLQAVRHIREDLMSQRTAKGNQIRCLVWEYVLIAPVGIHQLQRTLPCWLEDAENGLSNAFRILLSALAEALRHLDDRLTEMDKQIEKAMHNDPAAQQLMKLRGVNPLITSVLSVVLGDGQTFRRCRDFAAPLGLTPKPHSTSGRERLLGISNA